GLLAHQTSANHVGMTVEVFAGRVNNPVRSDIERTLIKGCRHRVVHDYPGPARMRPRDGRFDVDEPHRWNRQSRPARDEWWRGCATIRSFLRRRHDALLRVRPALPALLLPRTTP